MITLAFSESLDPLYGNPKIIQSGILGLGYFPLSYYNRQACRGMNYLHEHRPETIIHRDLEPS